MHPMKRYDIEDKILKELKFENKNNIKMYKFSREQNFLRKLFNCFSVKEFVKYVYICTNI